MILTLWLFLIEGEKGSAGEKGSQGKQGQKGTPGTCDAQGSSCCTAGCSTGFHLFEKVQDLPTRGAKAVEHFTIDGSLFLAFANYYGDIHKHKTSSMIYKMDEPSGKFNLYQTLQTRGARRFEYFSISDKHFLAVANQWTDGSHQLDSVVYQWNGLKFIVFQKISTNGGSQFTSFTISGEKYLAVANYHDGSSRSTKSVIYKWSSGKFNKFQEIATEGGHFVKLQTLQTYGALDVKSVNINGHTFLAFANHYSGSKYNTDSFIYKWDGNKFGLFQSIPTRGATSWYPFAISGQTYLGVANYYGDSQKYNTQSAVYQASGPRFIEYQEIPTQGARDMTSFEYKGQTYLAVVNYYNQKYNINSALYRWA
ncbi:receptor 98 [Desmophyllum pertusum]|uniref:Receptor 98 n=1 Tax=Desmophyllum pertusum TaxID=174260 RepID=A0A9W9ZCV0_9CNID|nr:receptor 98 [Desmophyllum pertusum]